METYVLFGCLVQLRDECLGKPDRALFKPDLDAALPVFALVEEDLGRGNRFREGFPVHNLHNLVRMCSL